MTVYICSKCLFCFERTEAPCACPDCGSINVRHANDTEAEQFRRNRAELGYSAPAAEGAAEKTV